MKATLAGGFLVTVLFVLVVAMETIKTFVADMSRLTVVAFAGAIELAGQLTRLCMGLVAIVVIVVCVWWLLRQQHEKYRQRDGAFALIKVYADPWNVRLANALVGKASAFTYLDMNLNMSGVATIDNGQVWTPVPSPEQVQYANTVEGTRRMQALSVGDAVLGNPLTNIQRGVSGVANAATAKLTSGYYDRQPKQITVKPEPEPVALLNAPPMTAYDAVAQSAPTEIVMGQTDSGKVVRWNMKQKPHLRFHGATQGAGKTNAIQVVAASAMRNGAHVVVLDPVNFKDWKDFDGRAELVDTTDPNQLADAFRRLDSIYEMRTRHAANAGARNISEMPKKVQRIIVIVSEFGSQMEIARADKVYRALEAPLLKLARRSGSMGIHIIAEDQVLAHWPTGLKANFAPVIGSMPSHQGQACGFQGKGGGTGTFAPFTFWYEGDTFAAPHMTPYLSEVLAPVPPPQALVMLTPPAPTVEVKQPTFQDITTVRSVVRSVERSVDGAAVEVVNTPHTDSERPNERQTERLTERFTERVEPPVDAGPTDLQATVWAWRDANPDGRQADMRRWFERNGIEIARGYAHEQWHKWPGAAASADTEAVSL